MGFVLLSAEIADTGRQRPEDHCEHVHEPLRDHEIVGVEAHGDRADEVHNEEVVRLKYDNRADFMHERCADIF